MKKIQMLLILAMSAMTFSACSTIVVQDDGRTVVRRWPAVPGTTITVVNNIPGSCMESRIVGPVFAGYDRADYRTICTSQSAEFFFADRVILGGDREVVILLQAYDQNNPSVYLGTWERRYRLRERGRFESRVEVVNRLDQPRRYRIRD
jgi:hypothetical protein